MLTFISSSLDDYVCVFFVFFFFYVGVFCFFFCLELIPCCLSFLPTLLAPLNMLSALESYVLKTSIWVFGPLVLHMIWSRRLRRAAVEESHSDRGYDACPKED